MKRLIPILSLLLCSFPLSTHSLDLKEVVEHTLDTHPEVLAALNEYKSREYSVKQARAGYLPTISVDAGFGEEQRRSPATGNDRVELTRQELGLSASQLIFDGFATSAEVGRQKARLQSAEAEMMAVADKIALRTTEVYLDVLRHAALLDLARQTLWHHQNIYDQMEVRHKTGVGSKADLDQIAARLALANANMVVAQNNYADAQTSYHRMTGMYPVLDSLAMPQALANLPPSREVALERALDQHPQLQAAVADVDAARKQHKAAGAGYWPEIRLEADKRWDENIGGIEGEDEDLIVAFRLKYNLFRGGADKAKRQQTAYLVEESKDVRNNTRRQVIESLNLSWNSFEAISNQRKFLEQHVNAAESTKKAYEKQFNIGRRTLLDLLNTENEVVDSRRALINAEFNFLFSQYRIAAAMGELKSAL